jgi:hypothetical protein
VVRTPLRVKYWEIIADNLSKAGWSWGCVSAIDSNGRTIWIADAHRGDGKRLVVRADENLTALLELEAASRTVRICLTTGAILSKLNAVKRILNQAADFPRWVLRLLRIRDSQRINVAGKKKEEP